MTALFSTVLIADDDPVIAGILAAVFAAEGADVTSVSNGKEAVAQVLAQPPSLLVLDAQMPEMDGYGASRAIRDVYPDLPIVIISANMSHWAERERAGIAGANVCIPKPINPATIVVDIVAALKLAEAGPHGSPSVDDLASTEALSSDAFNATLESIESAISAVRARFQAGLGARARELTLLAQQQISDPTSSTRTQAILHRLAGTSGSLGFHELSRVAETLLEAHRKGNREGYRAMLPVFCDELRRAAKGDSGDGYPV